MTVFIVWYCPRNTTIKDIGVERTTQRGWLSSIEGCFSTRDKAERAITEYKERDINPVDYHYLIIEREIDHIRRGEPFE